MASYISVKLHPHDVYTMEWELCSNYQHNYTQFDFTTDLLVENVNVLTISIALIDMLETLYLRGLY